MTDLRPTRVCIVQQIVPHYRVPVFDLLAKQPGIELSVWSGHRALGSLKPAKGSGAYEEIDAPIRRFGGIWWQPSQVRAAKSDRYDVIIFSWNARLVHLSRALKICRRRGTPTLAWGHGFSKDESNWRRALRNRLLNRTDGCILYNASAAQRLADEGFDRSRIFIAPNALDQAPIRAAREHWLARPDDLARFRAQHGLTEGATALFISRLEPDKRIDLLLEAFAAVVKRRDEARLALIGRGSAEDALRQQARRLGIERHVLFAGGVYDEMNLAPWFVSSACMAYPEAIGLSIFHAFGYGLPVVTSDDVVSHNPEIESMRDGANGLLYRDGDVADFAAKILQCMTDDDRRRAMSDAALETVRSPDGFCLERMVRGFTEAIAAVRKPAVR